MVLKANLKTAKRGLTRRKTKNVAAILAITLGVSLLVGTQITTATLKHFFKTNLLLGEGEVDFTISSSILGGYLNSTDEAIIAELVPEAVGILPQLLETTEVSIGSQYEPYVDVAGMPLEYDLDFGEFYDWITKDPLDISKYLTDNKSVLLSSEMAEALGIEKITPLPVTLRTSFSEFTSFDNSTGVLIPQYQDVLVQLSVVGVYDSYRPGIGAQHGEGMVMRIEYLQSYLSWADPFRNTDILDNYAIALKTDHYHSKIDKNELEDYLDALKIEIQERGLLYQTLSTRLIIIEIIDLIFDLVNAFLTVLGLLIVLTGLLLITNIQLLAVEDKEFQTGVLRAVGARRRDIFNIYLIEAIFQGIVGGILGLFGGLAFGWVISYFIASAWGVGSGTVTPIIQPTTAFFSVLIGVVLAIVTGLLPSIRAARVNVVEALRGIKTEFSEQNTRNYFLLGLFLLFCGVIVLSLNGIVDRDLQGIWEYKAGYDSMQEWEHILLAAGFIAIGVGLILSRFISPVKAGNITGLFLYLVPNFLFLEGFKWIETMEGNPLNLFMFSVVELVVGSIILVGLNLPPLMNALRYFFNKIPNFEGVSQIAPAMISSHKARSVLTFAIFGIILTLNVTIATMVATNTGTMLGQAEEDARGVDIVVNLSNPEIAGFNYTDLLYTLDDRIIDVIPFRSRDYLPILGQNIISLVYLRDPYDPKFDITTDVLPLRMVEVKAEQIRGNAKSANDSNWRYDFYLNVFPDGIREDVKFTTSDSKLLEASRNAWDLFFDPFFKMTAYNTTKYLESGASFSFGGFGDTSEITEEFALRDMDNMIINNSIIFTDSFILPFGRQIWLYQTDILVNDTRMPTFKQFTVGGHLDYERGAGFPVGSVETGGFGEQRADVMGSVLIPEHLANQTGYFGPTASSTPDQYNSFLIKTILPIDDPKVEDIGHNIEEYTNLDGEGYRKLTGQNISTAIAISLYSVLKENLKAMQQMTDMLQIYVSVGLVLGATGMAVISIRNVSERKREIGMMRAIGFPRSQVILSVLMELFILGIIGLVIGVVNGLLINVGFAQAGDSVLHIPWDRIALYLGFITFIAFISGAIPGWKASRIPPSEALRYVG